MERYLPEGCLWNTVENTASLKSTASLQESWREGRVLEGRVTLCDSWAQSDRRFNQHERDHSKRGRRHRNSGRLHQRYRPDFPGKQSGLLSHPAL